MERGPIFVAGLERSGTSLIFALLASHPNIAMTRRTNMWTYFYNQYGDLSQPENFEKCLDMMMSYKRLVVLKPDADHLRDAFYQGERTYARLFALLETQYAARVGKPRWGDKSLHTERYTDPIFAAYPGARILHMIRDPRDRYASVQKRWGKRKGDVGAGTAMWLTSTNLAKRNEKQYPNQYKVIRYESLVSQPNEMLQEICDFIGEEFCQEMFSMQGAQGFRDQGSNSSYGKKRPGVISTDSIGRFPQVLSVGQIAFIQNFTKDEMLALDYEPQPLQLSLNDRLRFILADLPLNVLKLIAWRTRFNIRKHTGYKLPDYRIVPRTT